MTEFFEKRADGYDEHMLTNVEGCREAYAKMAKLVPRDCANLLDLGCGTGLELDAIFKAMPKIHVTGIDLTQAMLDKLKQKHADKSMELICASYFDVDLGVERYDCAISFQTMHHFSREAKKALYEKVHASLKQGRPYIECDYMVEKQEEEDFRKEENIRIRNEKGIPEGEFYHYDIPFTIENQIAVLKEAGFAKVEKVFRINNSTILVANK